MAIDRSRSKLLPKDLKAEFGREEPAGAINHPSHEQTALHMLGNDNAGGESLLEDVDVEGLANGEALLWNSTTGKWEPGSAGGGGFGGAFRYNPDTWYTVQSSTWSNRTIELDAIYAHPFCVDVECVIDKVAISNQTTAVSSMRVLIYADSGSGFPAAKLYTSNAISGNTGGDVEAAIGPATLTAGVYWWALYKESGSNQAVVSISNFTGYPITGHPTSALFGAANSKGLSQTAAGSGGVAPSPFPTGASVGGTTPQVGWHIQA